MFTFKHKVNAVERQRDMVSSSQKYADFLAFEICLQSLAVIFIMCFGCS